MRQVKQGSLFRLPRGSDRRVARQSFWLGAILAVQLLTGLVQLSLSAHILGPEGLGVLFIIIAVTSLMFGLLTLPGDEVVITYVTRALAEERPAEAVRILRYALCAALSMRLICFGVIVVVAVPIIEAFAAGAPAAWIQEIFVSSPDARAGAVDTQVNYLTPTLLYALAYILTSVTGENLAVLRVGDRLHLGFAATVCGAAARIAVLVVALLSGGGLVMITLAWAVGAGVLGMALFSSMLLSLRPAGLSGLLGSFSIAVPAEIIKFQLSNFGRSSVDALNKQLDVLLVAGLTSVGQLGLYRAIHQIVEATRRGFEAFGLGVQSEYSKLWFASDRAGVRRLALRFTVLTATLGVAGYGLLAILREPVIDIVLGTDFAAAATPLLVMIPGGVVFACIAAVYTLPAATGRALPHFIATSTALVVQVIAMIAWTPSHGAFGAAGASSLYFLVFALALIPFLAATWRRSHGPLLQSQPKALAIGGASK